MAILANRVKIKNNLVELSKFTFFSVRKFFTLILIISACYLLYFSAPTNLANGLLEGVGRTMGVGSLIYKESIQTVKSVYTRLSYFKDLEAENLRLKLQLTSLEGAKQFAIRVQSENRSLREILNVTNEVNHQIVTAKIIGTAITPFTSSATIQAGSKDGVGINDIVRGKSGLIGRISNVSENYSTIMLTNDHNSRIPVISSNSKARGILAKQGDALKMIYLREGHSVILGEVISTSGDGKIYPKGVPIGTIEKITTTGATVKILENLDDIEFVIIESRSK